MSHETDTVWPLLPGLPEVIGRYVKLCAEANENAQFVQLPDGDSIREAQSRGTLDDQIWHSIELRTRLQRLTTDTKMRSVWKLLDKTAMKWRGDGFRETPDLRNQFLTGYLHCALAWIAPPPQLLNSIPTTQKQRRALIQVASLARRLQNLLGQPEDLRTYTLWNTLDGQLAKLRAGIPRLQRNKMAATSDATFTHPMWQKIAQLQSAARGLSWNGSADAVPIRALYPLFSTQLEILSLIAQAAAGMTLEPPAKRSSKAFQTWYIRRLASYVGNWLTQPLHQAIATTANVALGPKNPFTRQYIQQLLKG